MKTKKDAELEAALRGYALFLLAQLEANLRRLESLDPSTRLASLVELKKNLESKITPPKAP